MAITAALMMSASAMAQDNNNQQVRERRQMNPVEMTKRRTDETVKAYGLNEEQAKQLLELNTKFAGKLGPRGGMRPGRGMGGRDGRARGERPDSMRPGPRPQREGMPNMEDMRKNMEEYDAELKKIMTEEQYNAYQADRQKRFRDGRRNPGDRQRLPRDNEDKK